MFETKYLDSSMNENFLHNSAIYSFEFSSWFRVRSFATLKYLIFVVKITETTISCRWLIFETFSKQRSFNIYFFISIMSRYKHSWIKRLE